jgi:hypothetical protein
MKLESLIDGDSQSIQTRGFRAKKSRRSFLASSAAATVGIAGLGTVSAAASDEHTLIIEGFGTNTPYSFSVGEDLQKSTAGGASMNRSDDIIEQSAHGVVGGGTDAYTFTGPLYAFDFDRSGEINVTLDGEAAHVGNRPDHVLTIEGFGTHTPYSFAITNGNIPAPSDAYGASVNRSDDVTGPSARGGVGSGIDSWTFDGRLRAFDFDRSGEINVTLDGEAAHVGNRPDHVLDIYADGSYCQYEFSVSGSLNGDLGIDGQQDTITGTSASGAVSGNGGDLYAYDGEITSLDLNGTARVYRDAERIDERNF